MMLAMAVALVPAGSAATMCDGLVVTVGSSVPSQCMAGVFTFSNLRLVNPTGFDAGILSIEIGAPIVQNNGLDVFLPFGVNHPNVLNTPGAAGTADVVFIYEVSSAGIYGADIQLGTANNIRITENVCAGPHGGINGTICTVPPLLTSFNVASPEGPFIADGFFEPTDFVSIAKDIQFRGPNSSISDFVNSHHAVPEPGTMLLMGSALLGLAALRRRKQQ
jgi:hypothetical protein